MKKIFFSKNKVFKAWKITLKVIGGICIFVVLLFAGVFVAMKLHLTNVRGKVDSASQTYNNLKSTSAKEEVAAQTVGPWTDTPEWAVISGGFEKDKDMIDNVSRETDVPSRLIVSTIISEQFRFFNSNREAFKRFFQPLGILGNATQFSYGVAGIKTNTAMTIENNLKDPTSPYYPGAQYEHLLDFSTNNPDKERMDRLTDSHNHYYSYLYTALLLKEEMAQWKNAGYDISNRPEILATLFNIGFSHSNPNPNPETGGADITVNGEDYTFGSLAFSFYYSNQLNQYFSKDNGLASVENPDGSTHAILQ